MTWYVVTDIDGNPVSIGSVLADPLPDDLTATALTENQAELLLAGGEWVDGVVEPPIPTSRDDPDVVLDPEVPDLI